MNNRLHNKASFLVILLSVIVLAGWLGSNGLAEPDEGRFGEIAREMALQHDWLIPHLNGVPHFQKPPLTYWITAVFIRLLGPNEWAVRLTPALAALGTILFTMYISGNLYGQACQWKAGLVLLVSTGFFIVARLVTTDMLLTFFITAAVAGLIGYVHGGRKVWLCVFYGAMGLGFLSKGPLGIVIPAITAVMMQVEQWRRHRPIVRLYWFAGMPIALLIGLSWYLALIHRDKTLFDYFFRHEFIDRIASNTHGRAEPIWFYPGVLVLGLLPWTGFAFVALRDLWRRRRSLSSANLWLFAGWVVIPYVILTLVVSKLSTYLLPLMPPLAIIVARWLEHPETGDRWRRPARINIICVFLLLLGLPALGLIPRIDLPPLHELPAGFWLATVFAVASLLLLTRALGNGLPLRRFMFWMAGTWACLVLAPLSQTDTLITGRNRPMRTLARHIQRIDPSGTIPVFDYQARLNGLSFYLRRFVYRSYSHSDVVLPLEGELLQRIVSDERETALALSRIPAILVVKEKAYSKTPYLQEWRCVGQDGPWLILATRHVAEDAAEPRPVAIAPRSLSLR
ncbi:MAG: glycosyltransferase family 39 protein [Verrucomicrobiota bacterium]|nr:glycosyltransferase family 39 protein [Verrucomicrobiota bacterium]MDD8050222.1 glycosyltransferase family 39 protein [Verrucomicrobiota bacterium]